MQPPSTFRQQTKSPASTKVPISSLLGEHNAMPPPSTSRSVRQQTKSPVSTKVPIPSLLGEEQNVMPPPSTSPSVRPQTKSPASMLPPSSSPSMRRQAKSTKSSIPSLSTLSITDLPKTSLTEPVLVGEGEATLEYEIFNSDGDVFRGFLGGNFVSFVGFDNIEQAQMCESILQRLGTDEFVKPHAIISKPNVDVWLAVQKIDSTLDQFKKNNTGIWSRDDLLDDKYKIIVRDIISGVIQLVIQGYMGKLEIQDIAIIKGRAKLIRISNELVASKLRDQLQNLLNELLGTHPHNKELIDFFFHVKTMPMCKLFHLRNHPVLLTSQERLQFIVLSFRFLKCEKKSSNWEAKYDDRYREEEDEKVKRLEKDEKYKKVFEYKSDQKSEVNYIATKVEKDQEYKNLYKNGSYPNTASSQISFSRNVIVNINDDGQYRTDEEVEKKLKYFFPDLWMRLFSLMVCEGIDVWDEKYGGDLPSHWRATLKLCILEDNDLATEHFLKICRLFLSLIVMKADKSEAISSLVTMIKDRILTVESKFIQHQFNYRNLEGIIKDDNVSSTSTKLEENSCTNCINFLMRFLKFIALFLEKYALNADGDVKGMFKTAYSSLLKDHPDLKSLEEHNNLLESVPSNEEFKSLLGNPKNIKDCGKSVAESLMILTKHWHKFSNKKNANK